MTIGIASFEAAQPTRVTRFVHHRIHAGCFRNYASVRLFPDAPRGSISGSRLTITQAGLSPARRRNLARPHYPASSMWKS
jgi:hypothetical protein